jgi:hypothetical protein
MYNPYFSYWLNSQQPQQWQPPSRHFSKPHVVKPICTCCYCTSIKPQQSVPSSKYESLDVNQLLNVLNQYISKNQEQPNPYDVYYNLFLQCLNLLSNQSPDKNAKLAHALCEYFDFQPTPKPVQIKVEQPSTPPPSLPVEKPNVNDSQESKMDPQNILNQVYTNLTGQPLPSQISEAVTSVIAGNTKKLNAGQINHVMDEMLKLLVKKPEQKTDKDQQPCEAESILNEFLKTDNTQ